MLNVSKWLHTAKPLEAQRSQTALACTLFLKRLQKHFWPYLPFKNMSWVQTLRKCWSTNGLWPEGVKMNNYELTDSLKHACTGVFFFFFFSLILENRTFPDDNHEICGFVWVNSPSLPSLFFTSACSEINPCGYHPERASLSQESWKTYSYNSH